VTKRSVYMLLIALFGWTAIFGLATPTASAATACDSIVYDGANILGSGESDVESAAGKLEKLGADVRVVTLGSFSPSATLDAYIDKTVDRCPSWQSANGMRKNNLLIFAMSMDEHGLGIFYGESWKDRIDNSGGSEAIWSTYMAPQFANGNFSDGFVDGMKATGDVIKSSGTRSQDNSSSSTGKPTDLTGLFWVLGIIVGLVALGTLIWFIWSRIVEARSNREKLRVARQKALAARDATTTLTNSLGGDDEQAVRRVKVTKYSQAGESIASELRTALATVEGSLAVSAEAMSLAASASATPEDSDLTTGEYELMAERYEKARQCAQQAADADALIRKISIGLEQSLGNLAVSTTAIESRLTKLDKDVADLRAEGIHADDIDSQTKAAYVQLGQLKENGVELTSLSFQTAAETAADAAEALLAELRQRREQLSQGIPALEQRIAAVRSELDQASQCFERISSTYAPKSWEAITGNGSEAGQRIDAADQSLADARQQSSVEQQEWVTALESLQEGNLLLDKALSLLRSITKLEKNLEKARQEAKPEIDAAAADIDKAKRYIERYGDDIRDQLGVDLRDALQILNNARREFDLELPNYPMVVELALRANASADDIYKKAATEHEAAERLRRQAATALSNAQTAVETADEFIDDHDTDVRSSAETALASAKHSLQSARGFNVDANPDRVLQLATDAFQGATIAYNQARRDFNDAEDERREARERQRHAREALNSAATYSNTTHHHQSGGGGGFSGNWGSGGSGGGSSGSFHHSGGNGGGSSGKW
jgi:uncharacterized membrane protein YgcG